ncbi:ATP-binding cassette domain-containing protein [Rhizobiaceae bacterium BDR2-2]|uniref:ATP-binding cassette domain-containing protein n=1 Tax=Ectorhizobium quercum TaxID=2965071 RepID=A0AAE3MVL8_9HYPH|nr:ATP-binding cassette domain-containing protein [Ectorhizobium quercum]MCX8996018.1 ATP-binding cassette domain-containing protein [Ectorhizobium quercum]
MSGVLLEAGGLVKTWQARGRQVAALKDVSLAVAPGETLGLVGRSGCGKSTLARVLTRLTPPQAGSIRFRGKDWLSLAGAGLRAERRHMQMVFQDPLAAFNPRSTVAGALADPLRLHRLVPRERRAARIGELLERVGLPAGYAARSILNLSGGQRQRVAIARALACEPSLVVLDEAVSALDVAVRSMILDLLVDLQRERGLAYIFVSHDLAAVKAVSHRIAVMEAGEIVETGPAETVVRNPQSQAAKDLVAAVPRLVREGP